jgi:hypothetical protein
MGKGTFEELEQVERLPVGDGPIVDEVQPPAEPLAAWLGVVADMQSVGLDVTEAYTDLEVARRQYLEASLQLLRAEAALEDARAVLLATSVEVREGKNQETRDAILHRLLAGPLADLRAAKAGSLKAKTELDIALDNLAAMKVLVQVMVAEA